MEYLSKAVYESDKYQTALLKHEDWELLVQLNHMILKNSVGGWKKEEFLRALQRMDPTEKPFEEDYETTDLFESLSLDDLSNDPNKKYTKKIIFELFKKNGLKLPPKSTEKGKLIRMYLKEKIYKETKNQECDFDHFEMQRFLQQYRDRIIPLIQTIPEGNQGLLKVNDIVDVNNNFHYPEASRELLYFSNPLYTIFTMVNNEYYTLYGGHLREIRELNEMGIPGDDTSLEYIPDEMDDMIRMTERTFNSIKQVSLDVMKLVLSELYDAKDINHRSNINGIVNIILHGNSFNQGIHYQAIQNYKNERYEHSFYLFELLVNNGLEQKREDIYGVRYDVILNNRGRGNDGRGLLMDAPFNEFTRGLDLPMGRVPQWQLSQRTAAMPGAAPCQAWLQSGRCLSGSGCMYTHGPPQQMELYYYDICKPLLKDMWDSKVKLHYSKKMSNFLIGTVDPNSPLYNITEEGLLRRINEYKPEQYRESLRRQNIIGELQKPKLLAEQRLVLGDVLKQNYDYLRGIPDDVVQKILFHHRKSTAPIAEDKVSKSLKTLQERREKDELLMLEDKAKQQIIRSKKPQRIKTKKTKKKKGKKGK